MSSSDHYFHDYTDAGTSYRYRFVFLPAAHHTSSPTAGTPPEFGGAASTGWVKIPSLAVVSTAPGDATYGSAFCLGMPNTPTFDVTFDMSHMVGTAPLLDLAEFLTTATYASAGISYAVPNSSFTLTANTTPVLTVYSDMGTLTSNDVTTWTVAFQGAMLRNPTRRTLFNYANDTAIRTIAFVDIYRAVTEAISIETLVQYWLYNCNTTTDDYVFDDAANNYAYRFAYDALWEDSGTAYAVVSGARGRESEQVKGRYFSLLSLFDSIEAVVEAVYRFYVRDASASFSFSTLVGTDVYAASTSFDFVRLYERSYDAANTRGTEINNDPSFDYQPKDHVYVLGCYWRDSSVDYTIDDDSIGVAYDAGEFVGGLAVSSDPASLHAYSHLYNLSVDLFGGGGAKCAIQLASDTDLNVTFASPGDPVNVHGAFIPRLKPSNIYMDGEIEITEGHDAGAIRQVRVSLPDTEGEDLTDIAVAAGGGAIGDSEAGLSLFFSNHPYVGDEDSFHAMTASNPFLDIDTLTGTWIALSFPRLRSRALYYFDNPALLTGYAPILCHEEVKYDVGWGAASAVGNSMAYTALDDAFDGSFSPNSSVLAANRLRVRSRALVHQSEAGVAYAIAEGLMTAFSGFEMWRGEFEVDRDKALFGYIGKRYHLVDESNVSTGLEILAPTAASAFGGYPHYGYALSIAWNDTGTATLTLLGIPS